eukprot:TRINITY_DN13364_c0_g1_i1.p1 TRINITY_DN13364_c0_g1~~TRINITY_DN13364_c0_g1_i1.p1  ORF type:complete len:255 (+),score=71.45 TRINITY_DN13364_c0_g1_i1:35-799(+)
MFRPLVSVITLAQRATALKFTCPTIVTRSYSHGSVEVAEPPKAPKVEKEDLESPPTILTSEVLNLLKRSPTQVVEAAISKVQTLKKSSQGHSTIRATVSQAQDTYNHSFTAGGKDVLRHKILNQDDHVQREVENYNRRRPGVSEDDLLEIIAFGHSLIEEGLAPNGLTKDAFQQLVKTAGREAAKEFEEKEFQRDFWQKALVPSPPAPITEEEVRRAFAELNLDPLPEENIKAFYDALKNRKEQYPFPRNFFDV